jgi:hypothetical protein
LGAVRAILGAASRLDVHERAHLDGAGVVEFAVNSALRCKLEQERQVKNLAAMDLLTAAKASFIKGVS